MRGPPCHADHLSPPLRRVSLLSCCPQLFSNIHIHHHHSGGGGDSGGGGGGDSSPRKAFASIGAWLTDFRLPPALEAIFTDNIGFGTCDDIRDDWDPNGRKFLAKEKKEAKEAAKAKAKKQEEAAEAKKDQ